MCLLPDVCTQHGVKGYPTFKYFHNGKESEKYEGGRTAHNFSNFVLSKCVSDKKDELLFMCTYCLLNNFSCYSFTRALAFTHALVCLEARGVLLWHSAHDSPTKIN